jgi:hypothetical protein
LTHGTLTHREFVLHACTPWSLRLVVAMAATAMHACASSPRVSPQETPGPQLTRPQAVALALDIAGGPQPEIAQGSATASVVSASLVPLDEAMLISTGETARPSDRRISPVWLVTLSGEWSSAFPRAVSGATETPYHHMRVVLDARSEELLIASTYQ